MDVYHTSQQGFIVLTTHPTPHNSCKPGLARKSSRHPQHKSYNLFLTTPVYSEPSMSQRPFLMNYNNPYIYIYIYRALYIVVSIFVFLSPKSCPCIVLEILPTLTPLSLEELHDCQASLPMSLAPLSTDLEFRIYSRHFGFRDLGFWGLRFRDLGFRVGGLTGYEGRT